MKKSNNSNFAIHTILGRIYETLLRNSSLIWEDIRMLGKFGNTRHLASIATLWASLKNDTAKRHRQENHSFCGLIILDC